MCKKRKTRSETLAPPNPTYEGMGQVTRLEMEMRIGHAIQNERWKNIKWGIALLLSTAVALAGIVVGIAIWLWPPG